MRRLMIVLAAIALVAAPVLVAVPAQSAELGSVTKRPIPRYESLRSAKINVRRGPGLQYRKEWVFRQAGLPVRVVDEYGDWRRIVDRHDDGGWVYHALLTPRRMVLVIAPNTPFHDAPKPEAPLVARAEQGVVARLRRCQPAWCEIEAEGHRGWVQRKALWGIDPGEVRK